MFVASDNLVLSDHRVVNELLVFRGPASEYFLDDVVSIDVLGKGIHVWREEGAKKTCVLLLFDDLNYLLDASGSVHVLADLDWGHLDRVHNLG